MQGICVVVDIFFLIFQQYVDIIQFCIIFFSCVSLDSREKCKTLFEKYQNKTLTFSLK